MNALGLAGLAALVLLAACGGGDDAAAPPADSGSPAAGGAGPAANAAATSADAADAADPGDAADAKAERAEPDAPAPSPKAGGGGSGDAAPDPVSACLRQDGARLANPPLKATGTEPFWAAEIVGRCVTYSHPENIEGTRIWTSYRPAPGGGGTWTGALGAHAFVLRARPQAGCSDGMSDRRYPYAVTLSVGGEQRTGCAAPPGHFDGRSP